MLNTFREHWNPGFKPTAIYLFMYSRAPVSTD
jgi:hypothetical protein